LVPFQFDEKDGESMVKKSVWGAVALLALTGLASAQSNARIDELLVQPQAQAGLVAYLVLTAGAVIPEDSDPALAFETAQASGFLDKTASSATPLTLEGLSFLTMKALNVKGGLQWSLFPNPRAAYRELAFHKLINTSGGPTRLIAGDEVMRTLSAVIALKGGQK